jgi:hypothetical protein
MAAPLWSWILWVTFDIAIVVVACTVVNLSSRRAYGWMCFRGIPVWLAAIAAIAVGAFMFLGGWLAVVAWWLVRLPVRWVPRLYRSATSN